MVEHGRESRLPSPPSEVVASFASYNAARRAIDFLADRHFAPEQLALVAQELRLTRRLGYGYVAVNGAVPGAVAGALVGFVLGTLVLLTPSLPVVVFTLAGLTVGTVGGTALALVRHVISRTQREQLSMSSLHAGRYDLLAAAAASDIAKSLLGEMSCRSRRASLE